jgi:DNA-directed RNA polymerase specialized sigma24 family protein
MPRNEHKNDERSKPSGAGDAQAEGMIEPRIGRWQQTGENDAAVRREIHKVMLEQERSLARAYGSQIAHDVVESYAIIQEKTKTHFDATRQFRPWLKEVLVNRCIDVYRSKPKRLDDEPEDVEFDVRTARLVVENEQDDTLAVTTAESADEIAQLIADCLKRPYQRLIFSGASGIARFLSLGVLIEWCHALGLDPAMAADVQRIAADKTHGRLASLANILGSREDTVRQNFKRACAKVTEKGPHPLIRQLIKSRRKRRP